MHFNSIPLFQVVNMHFHGTCIIHQRHWKWVILFKLLFIYSFFDSYTSTNIYWCIYLKPRLIKLSIKDQGHLKKIWAFVDDIQYMQYGVMYMCCPPLWPTNPLVLWLAQRLKAPPVAYTKKTTVCLLCTLQLWHNYPWIQAAWRRIVQATYTIALSWFIELHAQGSFTSRFKRPPLVYNSNKPLKAIV